MFTDEEEQLDRDILQLQEELYQLKLDEKNLEIAVKILEERQRIDIQYRTQSK